MSLRIDDETGRMTSDRTAHRAIRNVDGSWTTTWLAAAELDRNQATTAMTIAETVAAGRATRRHPEWPHLIAWAAELGVGVDEAIRLAAVPPDGQP